MIIELFSTLLVEDVKFLFIIAIFKLTQQPYSYNDGSVMFAMVTEHWNKHSKLTRTKRK